MFDGSDLQVNCAVRRASIRQGPACPWGSAGWQGVSRDSRCAHTAPALQQHYMDGQTPCLFVCSKADLPGRQLPACKPAEFCRRHPAACPHPRSPVGPVEAPRGHLHPAGHHGYLPVGTSMQPRCGRWTLSQEGAAWLWCRDCGGAGWALGARPHRPPPALGGLSSGRRQGAAAGAPWSLGDRVQQQESPLSCRHLVHLRAAAGTSFGSPGGTGGHGGCRRCHPQLLPLQGPGERRWARLRSLISGCWGWGSPSLSS